MTSRQDAKIHGSMSPSPSETSQPEQEGQVDGTTGGRLAFALVALAIAALFGGVFLVQRQLAQRREPVQIAWEVSSTRQTRAPLRWSINTGVADVGDPLDERWIDDDRLDAFRTRTLQEKTEKATPGVVPPEERWVFEFDPGLTIGDYAKQLDALGIELGVVIDDETIAYATRLTDSKPKARRAPRESESRLFLTWSRGDLVAADRVLLGNAEIDAADKVVLHFLPEATRKRLEALEHEFQKRPVAKIQRTVFGLRDTFRGYEVYVKRQQERR